MTTNCTDHKWPLEAVNYKIINTIGKGSFSKVYHAQTITDNKSNVAIKVLDLENVSTSFEDILQEVQTMKLSDHNNILHCYCSFVESNQLWLVMQYMNLGSCLRVMNISKTVLNNGEGLDENHIAYILGETLAGLSYLHSNGKHECYSNFKLISLPSLLTVCTPIGQIHRDVKSGNILIDSEGHVRVADFGVSGWTVARGLRQVCWQHIYII